MLSAEEMNVQQVLLEPRVPEQRLPWLTNPALLAAEREKLTIFAEDPRSQTRCEVPLAAARAFFPLVDKIVSGCCDQKHCLIIDIEGAEDVLKPLQEIILKGSSNITLKENSIIRNVCESMKMNNNAGARLTLVRRNIELRTKNLKRKNIDQSTPIKAEKRSLVANVSLEDQKIIAMATKICKAAASKSCLTEQPTAGSRQDSLSMSPTLQSSSNQSGPQQQETMGDTVCHHCGAAFPSLGSFTKHKKTCIKSSGEEKGVEYDDNENSDEHEGRDGRYEVSKITSKRQNQINGETEYRAHWKQGDVKGAEEALKEFKKLESSAQKISNSDVNVRMNYFSSGFISLSRPEVYANCKDSFHSYKMIKDLPSTNDSNV